MTCMMVGCTRDATHTSLRNDPTPLVCELHHIWATVILADSYYRDHEPPDCDDGVQLDFHLTDLPQVLAPNAALEVGG